MTHPHPYTNRVLNISSAYEKHCMFYHTCKHACITCLMRQADRSIIAITLLRRQNKAEWHSAASVLQMHRLDVTGLT